jgi:hypothetical protein
LNNQPEEGKVAKFTDKTKKEMEVEVQVPEGVELTEEELKGIASEFENTVVETVSAERAAVALKVKVIPKIEEVQPKVVVVPKVKT